MAAHEQVAAHEEDTTYEQVVDPVVSEHVAQPTLPPTAPTTCQRAPRVVCLAEPLSRLCR